tara:strand:+ start:8279 stop:8848 length:570 start_codon:yes stop_codon:yes gene_type:complete
MKYLIQNTVGRDVSTLVAELIAQYAGGKNIIVQTDHNRQALKNFVDTLKHSYDEPCFFFEDDAILSKDFVKESLNFVVQHPLKLVSFWALKKSVKETTVMAPSSFMGNVCLFIPKKHVRGIVDFYDKGWKREAEHPTGMDLMVRDYLMSIKQSYILHQPNLAQHKIGVSTINPRRSKYRQSITFKDENI